MEPCVSQLRTRRDALSLHLMKCCLRKGISLSRGQSLKECPVLLHMAHALLVSNGDDRCVSCSALTYESTTGWKVGVSKCSGTSSSGRDKEPSTKLTLRVVPENFPFFLADAKALEGFKGGWGPVATKTKTVVTYNYNSVLSDVHTCTFDVSCGVMSCPARDCLCINNS